MNRIKFRAWILISLLLLLTHSALAFEFKYPPVDVEMQLQKVSDHVWFVQGKAGAATDNKGFISNAAVIIGSDGITVVDALGSPSLAELLLSKIREISDKPIKRVIVTHYHADHIYGLQVFKEHGAQILAPQGVDDYLNSPQAEERLEERRFSLDPWVNEKTHLVYPDEKIKTKKVLDDGDIRLTLNPLGKAHSDADLTVLVEPDNVLISGDVIFEGRVPFVGDSDSKAWLETLNRLIQGQKLTALIPGHGGLATEPDKAVRLTRDYLAFLREQLSAGVEEMMDFDELYSSIDWSQFKDLPAFDAANRTNAYAVYLALEKELLAE